MNFHACMVIIPTRIGFHVWLFHVWSFHVSEAPAKSFGIQPGRHNSTKEKDLKSHQGPGSHMIAHDLTGGTCNRPSVYAAGMLQAFRKIEQHACKQLINLIYAHAPLTDCIFPLHRTSSSSPLTRKPWHLSPSPWLCPENQKNVSFIFWVTGGI